MFYFLDSISSFFFSFFGFVSHCFTSATFAAFLLAVHLCFANEAKCQNNAIKCFSLFLQFSPPPHFPWYQDVPVSAQNPPPYLDSFYMIVIKYQYNYASQISTDWNLELELIKCSTCSPFFSNQTNHLKVDSIYTFTQKPQCIFTNQHYTF